MSRKIFTGAITYKVNFKISSPKMAKMATFLAKINILEYTIGKGAKFEPENTEEVCFYLNWKVVLEVTQNTLKFWVKKS